MIQNRYKYFRWTKRTAGITFVYVAVIPGIIGYLGYKTDVSLLVHSLGLRGGVNGAAWLPGTWPVC
jgi:uncharacterized membrane protein (UPF0136 family)